MPPRPTSRTISKSPRACLGGGGSASAAPQPGQRLPPASSSRAQAGQVGGMGGSGTGGLWGQDSPAPRRGQRGRVAAAGARPYPSRGDRRSLLAARRRFPRQLRFPCRGLGVVTLARLGLVPEGIEIDKQAGAV